MTNEQISQLIQAVIYLLAVLIVITTLILIGKLENDKNKREHEYIKTLNEHDQAVIMKYKTKTSWIQKGRKK